MTHRQSGHYRPLRAMRYAAVAVTLVAGLTALPSPAGAAAGTIGPTNPNITFVGRWDTRNGAAYVPGWAGACVSTGFTGTTVKLLQRNSIDLYYSIDGAADKYLTSVSGTVDLTPTKLASGKHTLPPPTASWPVPTTATRSRSAPPPRRTR